FQGVPDVGVLDHDPGTVERVGSEAPLLEADRLRNKCAGGRLSAQLRLDEAPDWQLASRRSPHGGVIDVVVADRDHGQIRRLLVGLLPAPGLLAVLLPDAPEIAAA